MNKQELDEIRNIIKKIIIEDGGEKWRQKQHNYRDKKYCGQLQQEKLEELMLNDMIACVQANVIFHKEMIDYNLKILLNPVYDENGIEKPYDQILKPMQYIALSFMIIRENSPPLFDNELLNDIRGGILNYQMGTGKTLISIIASFILRNDDSDTPTLVVVPSSLLIHSWLTECRRWIKPAFMQKIKVAHGKHGCDHTMLTPYKLTSYVIVISTYNTIRQSFASSYSDREKETKGEGSCINSLLKRLEKDNGVRPGYKKELKGPNIYRKNRLAEIDSIFYNIKWDRIILDESQNIKNAYTLVFNAMLYLYSSHIWCVTGTPFVNKYADLYSQFKMIGYKYSDVPSDKDFSTSGISSYFITKKFSKNELPELTEYMVRPHLSLDYLKLSASLHARIFGEHNFMAIVTYARILSIAPCLFDTRLPRTGICGIDSPRISVLKECIKALIDKGEKVIIFCNFVMGINLARYALDIAYECENCSKLRELEEIKMAKEYSDTIDSIINDINEETIVLLLNYFNEHKFRIVNGVTVVDRRSIQIDRERVLYILYERGISIKQEDEEEKINFNRINMLVSEQLELDLIIENQENIKYNKLKLLRTKRLKCNDVIIERCSTCENKHGLKCCLINGSVDDNTKNTVVKEFNEPFVENSEYNILFVQYKAGGVGLNLQKNCSNAIFLDISFSHSNHNQALSRIWRFGQTKPVSLYNIFISHSIDTKMRDICRYKIEKERIILTKDSKFKQGILPSNKERILNKTIKQIIDMIEKTISVMEEKINEGFEIDTNNHIHLENPNDLVTYNAGDITREEANLDMDNEDIPEYDHGM